MYSRRQPGLIWLVMALILASSSSSLPFSIAASSSRLKWVKTPALTLAVNDSAATNIPACIISCARPTLRRKVDLPPWFAPVIMISCLPSASTSLPTALASVLSDRQASYRPRADRLACPALPPTGLAETRLAGTGKQTGSPLAVSRSLRFRQPR